MKKAIFLTASLVFCGVLAFGQTNTSTVKQVSGNKDSKVTVKQIGAENVSLVEQNAGEDHDAMVEQYTPSVSSGTGAILGGDESTILQKGGKENTAKVKQFDGVPNDHAHLGNNSEIMQLNGKLNMSKVEQLGTNATSLIRQENNERSKSTVHQQGHGSSLSEIKQYNGKDNTADVYQHNVGGVESFVEQLNGDDNTAKVTQKISLGDAFSAVKQVGSDNYANVFQGEKSRRLESFVNQQGDDNKATVNQNSSFTAHSDPEPVKTVSDIYQKGTYNTANVLQEDVSSTVSDIDQYSKDNKAVVKQYVGAELESMILQKGIGNGATVNQTGHSHTSTVTQMGNGNTSNVTQADL